MTSATSPRTHVTVWAVSGPGEGKTDKSQRLSFGMLMRRTAEAHSLLGKLTNNLPERVSLQWLEGDFPEVGVFGNAVMVRFGCQRRLASHTVANSHDN